MISVIIPAYNAEKTIEKCVRSVLGQTYGDVEVIVINDGSKDSTEAVCLDLAKSDNRLRVISIENGGVSHARNVGIDNAAGEYLAFVDSDDFIDRDMFAELRKLLTDEVDVVCCSYRNVDENYNVLSEVGNKGKTVILSREDGLKCLINGSLFAGGLWGKIYKSPLFNGVRLDEKIKMNEDILADFYVFENVEKIIYTDKTFYNYVANLSSATHLADGVESAEDTMLVSRAILKESEGTSYYDDARRRMAGTLLGAYRAYSFSKRKNKKQRKKEIFAEMQPYKAKGFYNGKKDKITVFLLRYFPCVFTGAYKLYDKVRVKKLDPEQSV